MEKILITGACGQLGSEVIPKLREVYGYDNIIVSDIKAPDQYDDNFEFINVIDEEHINRVLNKYKVTQIYHLAAVLSAKGEKNPLETWNLNMKGLINILEAAKCLNIKRVFWPSSIAVFGMNTPSKHTPQFTVTDPSTVYGISKLAGERWCAYYHEKYGVDIRSLRYPGLISYKTLPGGGTTDYAIDIYHKAAEQQEFICFLKEDTYLPMMYMPDAIDATLQLMETDSQNVHVRSSYNISAMSFSPKDIAMSIRKYFPDFKISYQPDFRQKIADTWPESIDDTQARTDWGWKHQYNLDKMTDDILKNLLSVSA